MNVFKNELEVLFSFFRTIPPYYRWGFIYKTVFTSDRCS